MKTIEQLKQERDEAWRAYYELSGPTDAAYKKFKDRQEALKEAELYEKIKKQVISQQPL